MARSIVVLFSFALFAVGPAIAEQKKSNFKCETFAKTPVEWAPSANKCGFKGPRWYASYKQNLRWCKANLKNGLAEKDDLARAEKLGQCLGE